MINRNILKELIVEKINDLYLNKESFDLKQTEVDIINNFYITIWINNKPQIITVSESDWILNNLSEEEIADKIVFYADLNYKNANTFKNDKTKSNDTI